MAASSDTPQPGEELSLPPTEKRKKKDKRRRLTISQGRRKFLKEVYGAQRVSCEGVVEVFLSSYRQTEQKKVLQTSKKKMLKHTPLPHLHLSRVEVMNMLGLIWIGDPPPHPGRS
jgi:hypothetical protein